MMLKIHNEQFAGLAERRIPSFSCQVVWLAETGFDSVVHVDLGQSAPYHFGLLAQRPMA